MSIRHMGEFGGLTGLGVGSFEGSITGYRIDAEAHSIIVGEALAKLAIILLINIDQLHLSLRFQRVLK